MYIPGVPWEFVWDDSDPEYGDGYSEMNEQALYIQHRESKEFLPVSYREEIKKEKTRLKIHGKINRLKERIDLRRYRIRCAVSELKDLQEELREAQNLLGGT